MEYQFSIIIPVYNAAKTLHRCLNSIVAQSDEQVQIILVNDGSTDASAVICREYAKKHPNVTFIDKENSGVSSARNAGLDVAAGEYITFVDSDDYVADAYFETLRQYEDDFLVFPFHVLRTDGQEDYLLFPELMNAPDNQTRILTVVKNRLAGPWNKRYRRSIIEKYGLRFKQELTIGEDFIFGLEYMLHSKTSAALPKYLYCVDETTSNSITRAGKYDFSQFVKIYEYAFTIALESGWDGEEKKQLLQQLDYLYCRTAFAAAKHCVTAKKAVKPFLSVYFDILRPETQALNTVHRIMRLCIKCKLYPVFVVVAHVYMMLQ